MKRIASDIATVAACNTLLFGQIVFSCLFVGSCELGNLLNGKYSLNARESRWYIITALFFPSATQNKLPDELEEQRRRFAKTEESDNQQATG